MKKLFVIFFFIYISTSSNANSLEDWSNEDLCRWMDAESIPELISNEISLRELSCYVSCYNDFLTAEISYCKSQENINTTKTSIIGIPGDLSPNQDPNKEPVGIQPPQTLEELKSLYPSPAFDGIDMSGYSPPQLQTADSRIFYINGYQLIGSTTYINSLRSYLISIGRADAFSENAPALKPPVSTKFNFHITF